MPIYLINYNNKKIIIVLHTVQILIFVKIDFINFINIYFQRI